jgi:hypothetical protein
LKILNQDTKLLAEYWVNKRKINRIRISSADVSFDLYPIVVLEVSMEGVNYDRLFEIKDETDNLFDYC